MEVQSFDILRVRPKQVHEISLELLAALHRTDDHVSFQAYSVAAGYHGTVEGLSTKEFLSRFSTSAPQNLGPILGSGVVFYYGPHGNRMTSSITLDLSGVIADALYVKVEAVWDASQVQNEEFEKSASEYIRDALAGADLVIPGETLS
jgi:hypothetical protein